MAHITLITGGQRSGKSSYAQQCAWELSERPIYIATARAWDEDFKNRITRHQIDRGDIWITLEEEKNLSKLDLRDNVVVIDCLTLWLTNFYTDNQGAVEKSFEEAKAEWELFIIRNPEMRAFVITNELGMGVHPELEVARKFADLQGWMNQHIAKQADKVILMVAGLPVTIK